MEDTTSKEEPNLNVQARNLRIPNISLLLREPNNKEKLQNVVNKWEAMSVQERNINRMPLRELKQYAVSLGLNSTTKYTASDRDVLAKIVLDKYNKEGRDLGVEEPKEVYYNKPKVRSPRKRVSSSASSVSSITSASSCKSSARIFTPQQTSRTETFLTGILYATIGSAITGGMFYYKLSKLLEPKPTKEKLVPTPDSTTPQRTRPTRSTREKLDEHTNYYHRRQ